MDYPTVQPPIGSGLPIPKSVPKHASPPKDLPLFFKHLLARDNQTNSKPFFCDYPLSFVDSITQGICKMDANNIGSCFCSIYGENNYTLHHHPQSHKGLMIRNDNNNEYHLIADISLQTLQAKLLKHYIERMRYFLNGKTIEIDFVPSEILDQLDLSSFSTEDVRFTSLSSQSSNNDTNHEEKDMSDEESDIEEADYFSDNDIDFPALSSLDIPSSVFHQDMLTLLTTYSKTVYSILAFSNTRDTVNKEEQQHIIGHSIDLINTVRRKPSSHSDRIAAAIEHKAGNCYENAALCKVMLDLYLSTSLETLGYNKAVFTTHILGPDQHSDHVVVLLKCTYQGREVKYIIDPWSEGKAWPSFEAMHYFLRERTPDEFTHSHTQFFYDTLEDRMLTSPEYQVGATFALQEMEIDVLDNEDPSITHTSLEALLMANLKRAFKGRLF